MNDRDDEVRAAAMRALGSLREWRALEALTAFLHHYERGPMAEAALDGLGRIAHVSSQERFRERLADPSPAIRRYAAEGLGRSGNQNAAAAVATTLAEETDEGVRLAMAFASAAGGRSSAEALVSALDDDGLHQQAMDYLVELGPRALPGLRAALQAERPIVRRRAATVLGFIGGEDALALLETARRDPDGEVAKAAEWAMERMEGP